MKDFTFSDYICDIKEHKNDAIFILKKTGEIIACNAESAKLFNYSSTDELVGTHVKELVPTDFAELFPQEITTEHLTNGQFLPRVNKKKDNILFLSHVSTNYIKIDNGQYILSIVRERNDSEFEGELEKEQLKQNVAVLQCELKKEQQSTTNHIYQNVNKKLVAHNKNITTSDIKLATLIYQQCSADDIANKLKISKNSIYIARKRLRKKLNIPTKQTLLEFLHTL